MWVPFSPFLAVFVVSIRFTTRTASARALLVFALLLGALTAFLDSQTAGAFDPACCAHYPSTTESCFSVKLRWFAGEFLIAESFPVIAVVFRAFALAAADRGNLQRATTISRAGVAVVIVGVASLPGAMFWASR